MASRRAPRAGRRLHAEDGFTLFELLVAITVLAIGLVALVGTFDSSRDLVSVAEKTEVASHRAERELERILSLSYGDVGHASTPASSPTDPTSPAYYVTGTSYQYDQGSTGPRSETLADAGGTVGTTATSWVDSETRLRGRLQTFITWTGDYCTTADRAMCAKRVTVVVTVDGNRPLRRPVLISTVLTNPAGS